MTLKQLKNQQKQLTQQLEALNVLIKKKEALQTLVTCESNNHGQGCGKRFSIKNITYIQTHWYVEPHGCTGGDYWNEGEGNWICPKCKHRNRLYMYKDIEAKKHLFKEIQKEHERR